MTKLYTTTKFAIIQRSIFIVQSGKKYTSKHLGKDSSKVTIYCIKFGKTITLFILYTMEFALSGIANSVSDDPMQTVPVMSMMYILLVKPVPNQPNSMVYAV